MRLLLCLSLVVAAAAQARAQAPMPAPIPEKGDFVPGVPSAAPAPSSEPAALPQGWSPRLKLGSNASYNHNDAVVGSVDGHNFVFGLLLEGGADYRQGQHEWLNTLSINHQQTKNPLLDEFLKTQDELALQSMYLYHLEAIPWFGPFGRFRLNTAIFPSEIVYPTDTIVVDAADKDAIAATGDAESPVRQSFARSVAVADLEAQETYQMTTAFEPLVLRESLGAFANPVDQADLKAGFQLGGGVQQIIVSDGYVLTDDAGTPEVEITRLHDVTQIGAEAQASAQGNLDKRFSWSVLVNFLMPFYTSVDTPLTGLDLLNTEAVGKLSAKLTDWGSVDYVLTVKKVPLVLDEWQIQNGLLLSASFTLL